LTRCDDVMPDEWIGVEVDVEKRVEVR
jgi:hypothetical protein